MATAAEVRLIIGPDAPAAPTGDEEDGLKIFIAQAEALWGNIDKGGDNCGNTDEAADAIKCYLAAHFWAITNERGGIREIQIGSSREEYATGSFQVVGLGLTRFGQQALSMDISGCLRALEKGHLPAQFKVF